MDEQLLNAFQYQEGDHHYYDGRDGVLDNQAEIGASNAGQGGLRVAVRFDEHAARFQSSRGAALRAPIFPLGEVLGLLCIEGLSS